MKKLILIISLAFLVISCDKGIEPVEVGNGYFAGKITFQGKWPAGIARTHLVLFENYIKNEADFFPPNLTYVSNEIDSGTTILEYDSRTNNLLNSNIKSGFYRYIVVAQSPKEDLSLDRKDWTVVGVFYNEVNNESPAFIKIVPNEVTEGVDIFCDFNNPPPQPPGG